jgi:hypothetical protein
MRHVRLVHVVHDHDTCRTGRCHPPRLLNERHGATSDEHQRTPHIRTIAQRCVRQVWICTDDP